MSYQKHVTELFCSGIGFCAGVYSKIENTAIPTKNLISSITVIASVETIWYATLGATVGLIISFFGKILLNKLQRKFFPKWKD